VLFQNLPQLTSYYLIEMLFIQKLVNPLGNSSRYLKWNTVCLSKSISTRKLHSVPIESAIGEDAKKALRNFSDIKHAPIPALAYGIGGLIPFTSIPVYMLSSGVYIPEMAFTSMAYSAVILSFIGGVRWGSAVSNPEVSSPWTEFFTSYFIHSFFLQIMSPNWKNFTSSIAPSVVGWMSLLVSNPVGSILSITGFSLCLLQDITSSQFPSWYKSLRILLSTVAICALLTTFMCQFLLPLEPKKE
jgi:hypothetical protein